MNPETTTSMNTARPELVLSATLFLLNSVALQGVCIGNARAIVKHLYLLRDNEAIEPMIRSLCTQLIGGWEKWIEQTRYPIVNDTDRPVVMH